MKFEVGQLAVITDSKKTYLSKEFEKITVKIVEIDVYGNCFYFLYNDCKFYCYFDCAKNATKLHKVMYEV